MFERYTERARQVIVLAQDEARELKHNHIGTEHILLGLLREEEGIGARVLRDLGVYIDSARSQVRFVVPEGHEVTLGQIPFTPLAKKLMEGALRDALSLGHNYIGTEHLLLAVVREEGIAAQVLRAFGVSTDAVRDGVIRVLSGRTQEPAFKGQQYLVFRCQESENVFAAEVVADSPEQAISAVADQDGMYAAVPASSWVVRQRRTVTDPRVVIEEITT